jgi:hypothetical protein
VRITLDATAKLGGRLTVAAVDARGRGTEAATARPGAQPLSFLFTSDVITTSTQSLAELSNLNTVIHPQTSDSEPGGPIRTVASID